MTPKMRSHCRCDETFASCLKAADTRTSNRLGRIYFNYLCMECFKKDYPIVCCLEYKESFSCKRCQKYKLDEEKDQIWQFFDAQDYVTTSNNEDADEDELEEQEWLEEYKNIRMKEITGN